MPSTYGATPIQPNQNVQTKTGKYVGIGLLCACVLTIGVSMKEDASTFTGMSTKSENKIHTEFSVDEDFTSKRDVFLGLKGVNACPNGTEPIYDHTECRTQAANLGFSYYEKYTASSDNSVVCNYCSGCDKLNTPNIIEDGGSTVRVDQSHASRAYWVCKGITAKPTAAPTAEPTTSPTAEPTAVKKYSTEIVSRGGYKFQCRLWEGDTCVQPYLSFPLSCDKVKDSDFMHPVWFGTPATQCATICWVATGDTTCKKAGTSMGKGATTYGWAYEGTACSFTTGSSTVGWVVTSTTYLQQGSFSTYQCNWGIDQEA